MPEHLTRDQRVLYDHEHDGGPRRRQADDWGIDESFPRVRGRRFSRAQGGASRTRRHPVQDWGAEEAFGGGSGRGATAVPEAPPEQDAALTEALSPEPAGAVQAAIVESDERRTIRIHGRPGELSEIAPFVSTAARHRQPRTVQERLAGDPTRIIAWAFILGLLLILIAVATADAAAGM
ncbi:MAG TPA: hypothetical protein VES79_13245 [Solirubrobacteraceae bacterium]|nr:hypothetical protein [Solirubrobacteraceae bacterium]